MSQDTKTKVDLRAAQKALGEVQKALARAVAVHAKLSSALVTDAVNQNVGSKSRLDQIFSDIAEALTPDQTKEIIVHSNQAAQVLLLDEDKDFSNRLKATFSEAFRNLADYKIFSRQNKTRTLVTDALQNALIVGAGVASLRTNFEVITEGHGSPVPELMAVFTDLETVMTDKVPKIANALGVTEDELVARQDLAVADLKKSKNLSYISPLPRVA